MNIKIMLFLALGVVSGIASAADGYEMRTRLYYPIDQLSGSPADNFGPMLGIGIKFKANSIPSSGSSNTPIQWGLVLDVDGLDFNCRATSMFAGLSMDESGKKQLVARGDYSTSGCSNPDPVDFDWKEGEWYEMTFKRYSYLSDREVPWEFAVKSIANPSDAATLTLKSGSDLVSAQTATNMANVNCSSPHWQVEWTEAGTYFDDNAMARIDRVGFEYGDGACVNSKQHVLARCDLHWSHQLGNTERKDIGPYRETTNVNDGKTCDRTNDTFGEKVAKAYIDAVTSAASANENRGSVPGIDYAARGCTRNTVWDDACQRMIYNGIEGKYHLMTSIKPVDSANDWKTSNIQDLVPPNAMKRIMTDPEFNQVKTLFGYMSDPKNNWFSWLGGDGEAKQLLRRYMDSVN